MVFFERLRAAPARELVVVFTREELRYLREDLALHEGADGREVAGVFLEALAPARELDGQDLYVVWEEAVLPRVEAPRVASSLREAEEPELGADGVGAQARGGAVADQQLVVVHLYHTCTRVPCRVVS